MYTLTTRFIDFETIKGHNNIGNDCDIAHHIETYMALKTKYENKHTLILNKLDDKIILLSNQISKLQNKIELEQNITKRFFYKLEHISILINNSSDNKDVNHNKPLYLFLNKIYDIDSTETVKSENKHKVIERIVKTLYDNKHLKFDTPFLYENTITYNIQECKNEYSDAYRYKYNKRDHNPICNLFLIDNIDKIKLDYKHFYLKELEKTNNKNKTFNKQLKCTKHSISLLENENEICVRQIKELRTNKIESYKQLNKTIYNSYLTTLFNKNSNLGSINEFFFFDTKEVYSLIELIKDNRLKIANYKLDMKTVEFIKTKYNSGGTQELQSSIKSYNNKVSYGDVNYKPYNTITKYQLFDMIKHYDDKNAADTHNYNYPIIINELEGFRVFENKITTIYINFIKKQIAIGKENVNDIANEKTYADKQLDYYLNKKANVNKNVELYNNYKYYKTKIEKLEKGFFKKVNDII